MKLYEITFSPTGGTKKAADTITEGFDQAAAQIDLTDPDHAYEQDQIASEDVCVVAVPSYGGRIPAVCAERLMNLKGNGAYAIAMAVYGNREQEDTLLELKDILSADGFTVIAGIAAVAEHSIVRKYGKGRPDAQDHAQLISFTAQILEKLHSGSITEAETIPGNHPYRKIGDFKAMRPKATDKCLKCGICASQCPVKAIPADDPTVIGDACISCMRCISVCPEHARGLNPVLLKGVELKLSSVCSERKDNQLYL